MAPDLKRVGTRAEELLKYFSKHYVLGYKAALVENLRDAKSKPGASIERPPFEILPSDDSDVPQETRLESDIYVGSKFDQKSHWVMGSNWILTEIGFPSSGGGGCCGPKGSAQVEPEQEPPKDTAGQPAAAKPVDKRMWVDNKIVSMCQNMDCSAEVSKAKNCQQCGQVYCKKCLTATHSDGKTKICVVCDAAAQAGHESSKLPLMKDPGDNQRYINFYEYEVELHASERLSEAGASAAGEIVRPKGSEGKFLLVLKHKRPTRPTLTVAFEREDLRNQWRGVIQSASRNAPQPITTDPVLRNAFKTAYNELRWHCWIWGWWDFDGTEAELLADALQATIEREFLGAELDQIPAEFAKKMARDAVKKILTAAINPCWAALMKAVGAVRPTIEKVAASMLNPLFETEQKLKDKISAPMEEQAKKLVSVVEEKLQDQFGKKLAALPGFAEAQLNMIHKSAKDLAEAVNADVDKSASTFWSAFDRMVYQGRWTWWYTQQPVTQLLWQELLTGDSANVLTRGMYYKLVDDGIDMNQAVFRALRKAVTDAETSSGTKAGGASLLQYFRAAYPGIIQKTASDLALLIRWRLVEVLDNEIRPVVLEKTKGPIDTLCDPLQSMVPELLSDIINPSRTCIEIINDQVVKLELNVIEAATGKTVEAVKACGKKFGDQSI